MDWGRWGSLTVEERAWCCVAEEAEGGSGGETNMFGLWSGEGSGEAGGYWLMRFGGSVGGIKRGIAAFGFGLVGSGVESGEGRHEQPVRDGRDGYMKVERTSTARLS